MRNTVWILAISALLSGCPEPEAADNSDALEMKTYSVPAGRAEEITDVLNSAMNSQGYGRATAGFDGQVVVVTRGQLHQGVADLIDQLSATNTAKGPTDIELTYWIVAQSSEGEGFPPELAQVAEVIHKRTNRNGKLRLEHKRTLRSMAGEEAHTRMDPIQIGQTAVIEPGGERIVAELHFAEDRNRTGIETRVRLQPDQYLVLAELGTAGSETLYYIVQGRIITD